MRVVFITRLAAASLCALFAWGSLSAATTPKVEFTDTRLANGLRVIIAPDHHAPVFSIAVNYDVGSRNERQGRTGFAHLFEHMMFKGSANVGAFEHPLLVFNNGGNMNGTTNKDRTLYFETLPSNQLDLALFLEADRMRSLDITRENLDNQRNAVQEERRLGLDNQPYGRTNEVLDELAYDNFAYEHSVIGSMQDLNAASVEDVAAFFKTYYAPNNAVLSLAGDLEPAPTLAKVRKYFESIPRQPAAPAVDLTEPRQTAERRQSLDDALARLTRLDIAYKVPPSLTPDDDALSVLTTVLSGGRSSRLKNSMMPTTPLGLSNGNPKAACSPERWTAAARGKLLSCRTSTIHAGSPDSSTRPGSPSPGERVVRSLSASNSEAPPSACQVRTQRSIGSPAPVSHTAPSCQPSELPIASKTAAYTSTGRSVSASMRATACSTR